MQFPVVSHFRKAAAQRDFLRKNPDMRRVFGVSDAKKASKTGVLPIETPLSPEDVAHWNDFGFIILKGFFESSVLESYKRHIDALWQTRRRSDNLSVIFSTRGGHYFRDALDEERLAHYRLLDQYLTDTPTRDMSMHPRLIKILHQLMGHTPVVCNSIYFEYGSEQEMHSDMFYMPPKTDNQMLATWIALDDVTDDNGPLVYVPGSHKLPPHRFSNGKFNAVLKEVPSATVAIQKRMDELGLSKQKFFAKRGDVLIWHSKLMHGGDDIRDRTATRASIVTHYFSTCDAPKGDMFWAERNDGSVLLVRKQISVAGEPTPILDEHV